MILTRRFVGIFVTILLVLALCVAMVLEVSGNPGNEYLEVTGGKLLWCESITGDDPQIWVEIVDDLDGDGRLDILVRSEVGTSSNRTYELIAKRGSDGTHLWQESVTGENASMWAEVAGDLDSDGNPDVIVRSSVGPWDNRTCEVIAKKGSDGTHLWGESITGNSASIWAEGIDDLDGDGKLDILVHSHVGPWDNRTYTVIAKKGSDGTHLWQESITGDSADIWAEVAGDLDGDGNPDVIVRSSIGPWNDVRTDEVIAKRGSDGTHLWQESITGESAYIWAESIGDLDGDGLTDVLVESRLGPQWGNRTCEVIAKRGSDGSHLWQESITGDSALITGKAVDDLDGDGLTDVLVSIEVGSSSNKTYTVIAKKGSNGSHLWQESITGDSAMISTQRVVDFDGDGLADVLFRKSGGPLNNKIHGVIARRGNDGIILWQEFVTGPYGYSQVEVVDDFDGDGLPDVLFFTSVGPDSNETHTWMINKGSNGASFWQESVTGENASMWAELADDLDGDGNPDVIVWSRVGPWCNRTCEVIAKKGSDGTHFWEESITGDSASIWGKGIDDLEGDGKSDVLVTSSVGPDNNRTYTVIAKKGINGSHLWQESVTGDSASIRGEGVDDLEGDSRTDVLVTSAVGPDNNRTYTVIAKRGIDGSHLWQESVTGENAYMGARGVNDFDGDGKLDVLVHSEIGPSSSKTYTMIAKKGSDGAHFWEAEADDYIYLAYKEIPGVMDGTLDYDLDGDGKVDVVLKISNKVCAVAPLPADITVSIDAPTEVAPNSDFTADVVISQVDNLDSAGYNVSFDDSILRLDNVTNGQIDATVIPVDIWNEINPGTYTIIQNVPGLTGVTGSGTLAVLHFHVIGTECQTSPIDLSNGALGDNLAQQIPATWVGDSVHVSTSGVLPGDANGDGVVNNLDITKIERIIVGLDAETPGADANQDGVVNNLDITKVERIIVGLD